MMKWSRTLIAGGTLILLANAVALLGAGYNRSGDPESQLRLTQRELRQPPWIKDADNNGITLEMDWRVAPESDEYDRYSAGRWETPAWLDGAKMAELGFDVAKLTGSHGNDRHGDGQSREVLLVLELNGLPYQQAVQRAKEYAAKAEISLAGNPNSKEFRERAKDAKEIYRNEQTRNSRLFVIDAGIDLQKLRTRYPDRARYAIVHGLVRSRVYQHENGARVGGVVDELSVEQINVPLIYRQVFGNQAAFDVTVAFGKRLEPWIVEASRKAAAN